MRKRAILSVLIALTMMLSVFVGQAAAASGESSIVKGDILYSSGHYLEGQVIPVGYDAYGYNYQSHIFRGSYANIYLGAAGFPPYEGDDASYLEANPGAAGFWAWSYRDVQMIMKWNEAWLSNKDRDNDGKLDRHWGLPSYIGSGAWETNHMWGSYEDGTNWNYFVKIVAVPADATLNDSTWYTADGKEIGETIWGEFATIHDVTNDAPEGLHGAQYVSPNNSGFGSYAP